MVACAPRAARPTPPRRSPGRCEFQRQKFEILPADDVRGRDDADDHIGLKAAEWAVTLIRCPDSMARSSYRDSVGLVSDEEVKMRSEQVI